MKKIEIRTRKYKAGYIVKEEVNENGMIQKRAYTLDGCYIGNSIDAYRLCKIRGIKPELANEKDKVCSIGFCEKIKKWYGWSHRAICGFGIGDKVRKGDCTNSSGFTEEYLRKHPEEDLSLPVGFKAKTIKDAKKMAIAFAESVG